MNQGDKTNRYTGKKSHLGKVTVHHTSVFYLADISVSSPRKLFIFLMILFFFTGSQDLKIIYFFSEYKITA